MKISNMAATFLLLLLLLLQVAAAQQGNSSLGSTLYSNNNPHWLSNSGQFAFGFYWQGNDLHLGIWFEKTNPKTIIWTATRDPLVHESIPNDARLIVSVQGLELILEDKDAFPIPVSNSSQPLARASLLDSGNFVLYNSGSDIVWQTFDFPTDTIVSGQRLLAGKKLISSISHKNQGSGRFQVIMQRDGNLVQYPAVPLTLTPDQYAYWASDTFKAGVNVSLNLDQNGELYLLNSTGFKIKSLIVQTDLSMYLGYRLTIDADGILRLYCEAATFRDQTCRKQKLPLRFGRTRLPGLMTTFVKKGTTDQSSGTKRGRKKVDTVIFVSSISTLTFSLVIMALAGVVIYRYRVLDDRKVSDSADVGLIEGVTLRSYKYRELQKATKCFTNQVGKGAFGTVFKGVIGGRVVAVKQLENVLDEEREFRNEMNAIGRTHHKNLVKLLGYCHDGTNRLLVYEFMTNGSLADFFFKSNGGRPTWEERIGIALNVAQGYVAPEWHRHLTITVKADVYSFGVVLLEIICCQRCMNMAIPDDEVTLENWMYHCLEANELEKLVKDDEVDMSKLRDMVKLGLCCIQEKPSLRPSMKKVVLMLEGTLEIPSPPNPFSSRVDETN